MKRVLNIIIVAFTALIVVTVASCNKLDVIGSYSIRAFDELLQNNSHLVSDDTANGGWSFAAPDSSARFIWSRNFEKSPLYDVMVEFDAAPFLVAGLDPAKLPHSIIFRDEKFIVGVTLGNEELTYESEATPLASYAHIVRLKRKAIGYHGAMDHYGVSLGGGHLFEWAKNLTTNDKDIVFVLDPDVFIKAGVDPNKIEGWVFTKVPVKGENGKMIEVDKILKPFDLL